MISVYNEGSKTKKRSIPFAATDQSVGESFAYDGGSRGAHQALVGGGKTCYLAFYVLGSERGRLTPQRTQQEPRVKPTLVLKAWKTSSTLLCQAKYTGNMGKMEH